MRASVFTAGVLLSLAFLSHQAHGVTQPVVVNIAFDTPLSFTKSNDISFGIVAARQPAVYIISPEGAVSTSNGHVLGGMQQAGKFTIVGSDSQTVDISVSSYTPNAGVTPSAATCAYNGNGHAVPCDLTSQAAPGKGKTLLVGATVAVDGSQKAGTRAAPSFDVVVNYH